MSFVTSIVVTFVGDKLIRMLPIVKAILKPPSVHYYWLQLGTICNIARIVFEILQTYIGSSLCTIIFSQKQHKTHFVNQNRVKVKSSIIHL